MESITCRYVLDLPWPRPPLRSNDSWPHPAARGRVVKQVRETVAWLARAAKIPTCQHLTVQFHYAPGSWQRMDSPNLYPTAKACVDALANPTRNVDPRNPRSRQWVGLQLVPDDTDEYVTVEPSRVVRPPEPGPRCWLVVEVHQ